jgi:hypothetical protein
MVRRFLALLLGAVVVVGCADPAADPQPPSEAARAASVLTAIITTVAELGPDPEVLPVVYAVGSQGTMEIEIQAAVAGNLVDLVDLRFADDPAEAFEEINGESQIREGAILLVIGEVPAAPDQGADPQVDEVELVVTRHLSGEFSEDLLVSAVRRDLEWVVTQVVVVDVIAVRSPAN